MELLMDRILGFWYPRETKTCMAAIWHLLPDEQCFPSLSGTAHNPVYCRSRDQLSDRKSPFNNFTDDEQVPGFRSLDLE